MPNRRKQAHEFYDLDYKKKTKLARSRKFCPRCKGSFLAEHKDRRSCGHCGYTEY
ncbi:MAG: 30S ribosomal protein S27ae [Candidatus Thorarchaeota archaeon]